MTDTTPSDDVVPHATDALDKRDVRSEMRKAPPGRTGQGKSNVLPTRWMFDNVFLISRPAGISSWIPNAHMLFIASISMYRTLQSSRRAVHIISQISNLEYIYILGLCFMHQILRAKATVNDLRSNEIDLLDWYDANLPATIVKIPGPLVPFLKVLCSFTRVVGNVKYIVTPTLPTWVDIPKGSYMIPGYGFYLPNFPGILRGIQSSLRGKDSEVGKFDDSKFELNSEDVAANTTASGSSGDLPHQAAVPPAHIVADRFLTPGTAYTPHYISSFSNKSWRTLMDTEGQAIRAPRQAATFTSWIELLFLNENALYIRSAIARFNAISECFDGSVFLSDISASDGNSGSLQFVPAPLSAAPTAHNPEIWTGVYTCSTDVAEPELSNAIITSTLVRPQNFLGTSGGGTIWSGAGNSIVAGQFWELPNVLDLGGTINIRQTLSAWIRENMNDRFLA